MKLIRDSKNINKKLTNGFTQIDNIVLLDSRLTNISKVLYTIIKNHQRNNEYAFPTIEQLADELNVNTDTVRKHLLLLNAFGYIQTKRTFLKNGRFSNNTYFVKTDKFEINKKAMNKLIKKLESEKDKNQRRYKKWKDRIAAGAIEQYHKELLKTNSHKTAKNKVLKCEKSKETDSTFAQSESLLSYLKLLKLKLPINKINKFRKLNLINDTYRQELYHIKHDDKRKIDIILDLIRKRKLTIKYKSLVNAVKKFDFGYLINLIENTNDYCIKIRNLNKYIETALNAKYEFGKIIKQHKEQERNKKVCNYNNFSQRKYDDAFFNSLFDNI